MNNILVIKLRYIGDVLLSTPVIQRLRQAYPRASIVCLVNPGTEEVLAHHPDIDEVLVLPRHGWRTQIVFYLALRKRRFDGVIDLTDGDRSAFLSGLTGAPLRVGFNVEQRWRGRLYSHCVNAQRSDTHIIDHHLASLACLGLSTASEPPTLVVGRDAKTEASRILSELELLDRPWVMIHPAARYALKAWPVERFAELSDRLADEGIPAIVVGSDRDRDVGAAVARHASRPLRSLIGRTRLLELAALAASAAVFVGNDTGVMHIAAAMGCPVVAMFGPTSPAVWGPHASASRVLYKGLDCRECFHPGCFRGDDSCMRQIMVDEVFQAVLELWPRRASSDAHHVRHG